MPIVFVKIIDVVSNIRDLIYRTQEEGGRVGCMIEQHSRPGHVSFDERSRKLATVESFGRLGVEGSNFHRPAGN